MLKAEQVRGINPQTSMLGKIEERVLYVALHGNTRLLLVKNIDPKMYNWLNREIENGSTELYDLGYSVYRTTDGMSPAFFIDWSGEVY